MIPVEIFTIPAPAWLTPDASNNEDLQIIKIN